jgi:hypothetical protein
VVPVRVITLLGLEGLVGLLGLLGLVGLLGLLGSVGSSGLLGSRKNEQAGIRKGGGPGLRELPYGSHCMCMHAFVIKKSASLFKKIKKKEDQGSVAPVQDASTPPKAREDGHPTPIESVGFAGSVELIGLVE